LQGLAQADMIPWSRHRYTRTLRGHSGGFLANLSRLGATLYFGGETVEESPLFRLFLQHRHVILAYINTLTRDRAVSEEIFQEVGLAIAQQARNGVQVDHFVAWALEIAKRQTSAYYRSRQRQMKKLVPLSEALAEVVAKAFYENERLVAENDVRYQLLETCLEELKGRGREVIEQRYKLGRSISAIAEALAWKPESVKVALCRARQWLRNCVQRKLRRNEGFCHE
jgi:RNA polymerase sigma-70 factor (ECF subfamily)